MEKQKLEVFTIEVEDASIRMDLLNEEQTEVFELTIYKQSFDKAKDKWSDDEDVLSKATELVSTVFGCDIDDIESIEGQSFELFVDDKGKAYAEEPQSLNIVKPTLELEGSLINGVIIAVVDFDTQRKIVIETADGVRYSKNFNYSVYNKKLERYILSKSALIKQEANFKKITGANWSDDTDALIGRDAVIEIKTFKSGSNTIPFVELKKLQ